jgi:general secretion pathway protein F
MPRFDYKAYDDAGRLQRGEIDADSARAALDALSGRGLFPLEVEASERTTLGRRSAVPWWQREIGGGRTLPLPAQATLARELATLVKADLPIDETLRIIALQPRLGRQARALVQAVENRVTGGASLSEALAAEGDVVPEHFWRLVRAGEESGSLAQVLTELATFLERSVELRTRILTAMLYPMLLLAAAALTIVVILSVMLPAILPLFRDAGVEPPVLIRVLSSLERALLGSPALTLTVLAAMAGGVIWTTASRGARDARDRVMLRLPLIGGLVQRAGTARFARTMATLLRNGVPMLEALHVSSGVMRNGAFRAAIEGAGADVNRGGGLLAPLTASGLFPDLALRLIGVGEQSGQLPSMLGRVADIYDHDLQQQLERILAVATPLITIFSGGLVGFLLLTVMSAMLGLNETVLR